MLKLILVITFFTTLVFAIFLNARYLHLKIHGHQTTAQIIGYHQRTGNPQSISNADQSYAAIFVFYNNKSEPIEVQSSNYYKEKKYEVGQKVAVYFLHNSFNAIIKDETPHQLLFFLSSILILFGVIIFPLIPMKI